MATVKFLPQAERDLLELPHELQEEIIQKAELLVRFPQMGRALERAFQGYRCLMAGRNRYRIIYRVLPSGLVEIAYIRHCRRQLGLRIVKSE